MQNESGSRIAPLLPPDWDAAAMDALGAFPKSLDFVMSKWRDGGLDARGMHALGTLARHPPLAKAFMTFNAHVSGASTLDVRVREIVILRLSWLRRSEYELVQHLILGRRAGLSEADLERVRLGPTADGWDPADADLVRATDELCANARIGDATWTRLALRFNTCQMMDLVFVIGAYEVLAMALNSFGTQLEPGVQRLGTEARAHLLAATPYNAVDL